MSKRQIHRRSLAELSQCGSRIAAVYAPGALPCYTDPADGAGHALPDAWAPGGNGNDGSAAPLR